MNSTATSERDPEVRQIAEGWKHFLRLTERMRRRDEGEPLLQVVNGGQS